MGIQPPEINEPVVTFLSNSFTQSSLIAGGIVFVVVFVILKFSRWLLSGFIIFLIALAAAAFVVYKLNISGFI